MILQIDAYDPLEEESRGENYFTKKDIKWVFLALVAIGIILTPVFMMLKKDRDRHLCIQNMRGLYQAMLLYGENNDARLPPLYAHTPDKAPIVDSKGRAFTWVSLVQGYLSERTSANCPAADKLENTPTQHPTKSALTIQSSYGMVSVLSAYASGSIPNENQTILVAESINGGAADSFDPKKLPGTNSPDGFSIAYDDSNEWPTAKSQSMTRLAFYDSAKGDFNDQTQGRHGPYIHGVTAAGGLVPIKGFMSKVKRLGPGKELVGIWTTPPQTQQ